MIEGMHPVLAEAEDGFGFGVNMKGIAEVGVRILTLYNPILLNNLYYPHQKNLIAYLSASIKHTQMKPWLIYRHERLCLLFLSFSNLSGTRR